MGLTRIVSEINGDFRRNRKFCPLSVFNASAKGVPILEFRNGGGAKKTRVIPLPDSYKL